MLGPRSIEVISPVGADVVVFEHMSGEEALGRPFEYTVDLLSPRGDLPIEDAMGKSMTVVLEIADQPPRYFDGIVSRFAQVAWTGGHFRYRATLRPWSWLLTRTSNSRIFQNKTIPKILAAVFESHGRSGDVDATRLDQDSYKPREYVVQYNETDFNFVSRLMEQAGITYQFTHTAGRHTLVLSDGLLTQKAPGYATIPFFSGDSAGASGLAHEHIGHWNAGMQVTSAAFVAKEFDFQNPKAPLLSVLQAPQPGSSAKLELFEYPGHYIDDSLRQAYVSRRLEEVQMAYELNNGAGDARGIQPGTCFQLTDYPWDAQNKDYLVTAATYTMTANAHITGTGDAEPDFRCQFYAIDAKRIYRTPALTPKPRVAGPQTAIVAGDKKEEIWVDKYGRVKVQFHWDREGKDDENSSCWVRVSQAWAGAKWGSMHIPRIGQEVIVDFLEGDPDRPIITGRVYNNDQMPPYDLPDNKTQSGIKSRSTPKGAPSNFNEIRFEDKKGSEELFIQAEKNQTTKVKNDRSASVGASDSVSVGGDRSVSVNGNLSVTVKGGGKSAVHSAYQVTGKHTLHASDTIEIEAPTHIQLKCGDSIILMEPGKITLKAGGKAMIVLDANVLAKSADESKLVLDANVLGQSKLGSKLVLDANAAAKSSGGAQVALDKNALLQAAGGGNVTIDGTKIQVTGKAEVTVAAGSGNIKASAPGVEISGGTVKVNG